MDYDQHKIVTKFKESDTNEVYRILSAWNNNNLLLNVICSSKAWIGKANIEELSETTKQFQLDVSSYKANLLNYLQDTNLHDVTTQIKDDSFTIWKRVKAGKIKYFEIKLDSVDFYNCVASMLDYLIDDNIQLKQQMCLQKALKEEADTIRDISVKKLEEYVKLHNENEQNLYGKFVLLLNEKKSQIQHLNATIERITLMKNIKTDKEIYTSDEESLTGSETPPRKKEIISDSESGDDVNLPNVNENIYNVGTPSTSKSVMGILLRDDSNSPPPTIKKLKTNTSNAEISEEMKPLVKHVIEKNVSEEKVDDEQSPTLEFNTQDLLNRL